MRGKRIGIRQTIVYAGDHPRRCGENKTNITQLVHYLGSPPQVRGKQLDELQTEIDERITPAGAGKTHNKELSGIRCKDHPRRCGENPASALKFSA